MGIKNGFSHNNNCVVNTQGQVDAYIGTSYDIVKEVQENLDIIEIVASEMEHIHNVENNMDNIVNVSENMDEILAVYEFSKTDYKEQLELLNGRVDQSEADILNLYNSYGDLDTRVQYLEDNGFYDDTAITARVTQSEADIISLDDRVDVLELNNNPVTSLNDLNDVNVVPNDNQVLTFNEETGEWNAEYSTTALGITQFSYKMQLPATVTPDPKFLSKDVEDPNLVTMLYINKNDDAGETDLTLFLENIRKGDWLNIFDKQDSNNFEAYDVVGDVVLNGDIFEVPVIIYESTSTISANTKIRLFWRRYSFNLDLENIDNRVSQNETNIESLDLRVDALELDNSVIDQTARDSAAAAQSTADNNETAIVNNILEINSIDSRVTTLESNSGGSTAEKYVLSAKDLTKEGYVSLKSDAYILASEAPILAGIKGNKTNITPMAGGKLTEASGTVEAETNNAAAYKMGQFYNAKSTSGRSTIYDLDLSTKQITTKIDNQRIISYLGDDKMIVANVLAATGILIYSYDKNTTDMTTFINSITIDKSLPNYIADSFGAVNYDPLNNTVYNNDYTVFISSNTLNILNHNDILTAVDGDTYKTIDLISLGFSSGYISSTKVMPILSRNNNLFLSSEGSDIVYIINLESEEVISHKLKEIPGLYCRPSFNGLGDSYYIHNRVDGVTVYDTDNFNILYEREGEYLGFYAEIGGNIIKTSNANNSRIGTVKSFDQITINETTTTFTELGFTDLLGFTWSNTSTEYRGSSRAHNEGLRDGYMLLQRQSNSPRELQVLELNEIVSDYIKFNAEDSASDKSWYVFKE